MPGTIFPEHPTHSPFCSSTLSRHSSLSTLPTLPFPLRFPLHTFRSTLHYKILRSTLPTLHSARSSPFHALLVPVHIPAPVFTLAPLGTPTLHPTLSSTLFSKLSNPASSPLSRRIARSYPLKKIICPRSNNNWVRGFYQVCRIFQLVLCFQASMLFESACGNAALAGGLRGFLTFGFSILTAIVIAAGYIFWMA